MKNQATVQMVERILPTPEQQAEDFGSVREAHRMETSEDYVELIDDLIKSTGEARLVDVAAVSYTHLTLPTIYSV